MKILQAMQQTLLNNPLNLIQKTTKPISSNIYSQISLPLKQKYFKCITNNLTHFSLEKSLISVSAIGLDYEQRLSDGRLEFSNSQQSVTKIQKMQKEIKKKNNTMIKSLHNLEIHHERSLRKHIIPEMTQIAENQQSQVNDKLTSLKKEIILLRQKLQQKKQGKKQQDISNEQKQIKAKDKRQRLLQKIEQINKRKEQRSQIIKERNKSSFFVKIPKYIVAEKQFNENQRLIKDQSVQKLKKDKEIIKQRYSPNQIKKHIQEYELRRKHLHPRRVRTQNNDFEVLQKTKEKFIINGRTGQSIKNLKENSYKIKQYSKIIRNLPIAVSVQNMILAKMNKDKAQNPFKYNFLSQKHLTDFEIYNEFQNFNINSDCKKIGDQYLKQVIKKVAHSSRMKNQKAISLDKKGEQQNKKKIYENYLPSLKIGKKQIQIKQESQIENIIKRNDNESGIVRQLEKISKDKEASMMKKIHQMCQQPNYQKVTQKQKLIDDDYIQSLKYKIALTQFMMK